MKFKINKKLIPIKAHFFFFFAAIGPILPQVNVFGKQLGISPVVMGVVTAILPILWALAKPAIGFLVDYFHSQRKFIFMCLIFTMSGAYFCMYFLPEPPMKESELFGNISTQIKDFKPGDEDKQLIYIKQKPLLCQDTVESDCNNNTSLIPASCGWICTSELISNADNDLKLNIWLSDEDILYERLTTIYHNYSDDSSLSCKQFGMNDYNDKVYHDKSVLTCASRFGCRFFSCAFQNQDVKNISMYSQDDVPQFVQSPEPEYNLYLTITFWGFVIFMATGTVGFNVANCIGDAVCFDVLGNDHAMKYGFQRAFGTAGYGITALVSGWIVDFISGDNLHKDFTPAFVIMAVFTIVDLFFCRQLELPSMTRPEGAAGTLSRLLREKTIFIFLCFAVVAGIFDSFIIYYMFWFLEDIAMETGSFANIKFLEGLIIAVESFGGEILFFSISGKVLNYFGFRNTLSFCLACYAVRLFAISLITETWHLVIVEMFLQGPTYALCYSAIVGYAAAVAPPGLSATLQGIMAGMDDGVGFAFGSLIGGVLYKTFGGKISFRVMSAMAIIAAVAHAVLAVTVLKNVSTSVDVEEKKADNCSEEEGKLMINGVSSNAEEHKNIKIVGGTNDGSVTYKSVDNVKF